MSVQIAHFNIEWAKFIMRNLRFILHTNYVYFWINIFIFANIVSDERIELYTYIAKSFIHCYDYFLLSNQYFRNQLSVCVYNWEMFMVILEIEVSSNSWDGEILKECCLDSINCDRSKRVCQRSVQCPHWIYIDCNFSVTKDHIRTF